MAEIHDRMPLILAAADYSRWLSDEPDPRDLLQPFPAEPMRMWPISTRVNKPENDDPSIAEPVRIERACGIVAALLAAFATHTVLASMQKGCWPRQRAPIGADRQ